MTALSPTPRYKPHADTAEVHLWLRKLNLSLEDVERVIVDACRGDLGATPTDIVRYVIDQLGITWDDEDKVRWIADLALTMGSIEPTDERTIARRFRATTPPPQPRVLALVAFPPDDFELYRPYIHRGRPAFVIEG